MTRFYFHDHNAMSDLLNITSPVDSMTEQLDAACVISFDRALLMIEHYAGPLGTERVPLEEADCRSLAQAVIAERYAPPFLTSAMDGYAVRQSDLKILPHSLRVVGKSFAGSPMVTKLPKGACMRVFTGAPVPLGADRVILQEEVHEKDGFAHFRTPLSERQHLRSPGSDFAMGDILVSKGQLLTPQKLIAAAAADVPELVVFRRPKVAILCCGDELAKPGQARERPTYIPESISYGISALVRAWGGIVTARYLLPDDLGVLEAAALKLMTADVAVIIGGASVGEKDLAKSSFAAVGLKLIFSKVAIKPGKPAWFGKAGETLVLGLPGNPTAALIAARLFLAPLLVGLGGRKPSDALAWEPIHLSARLAIDPIRDWFMLATVSGRVAHPLDAQDSATQKILGTATHILRRRASSNGLSPIEGLAL